MFNSFPSRFPDGVGGAVIKSVQWGKSSIASGASVNVPISAVDPNKSIILINPSGGASAVIGDLALGAQFTSGTNFQAIRAGTGSSVEFTWQVVEFADIKSKQSGTTSVPAITAINQPISPVNVNKSMLFCSWTSDDTTTGFQRLLMEYSLTNSTTLTFLAKVGTTKIVYWYVVEFP